MQVVLESGFMDTLSEIPGKIGDFFSGWNVAVLLSLGILLVFAFIGHRKGIARGVVMVLSMALAVVTVALLINMIDDMLHDKTGDGIKAFIFLVLVAFLFWIFYFIGKALKILHSLPVVHAIDGFLGMILGIVVGIVVILLLFVVLQRYDLGGHNAFWIEKIGENSILNWCFIHNPIKEILFK